MHHAPGRLTGGVIRGVLPTGRSRAVHGLHARRRGVNSADRAGSTTTATAWRQCLGLVGPLSFLPWPRANPNHLARCSLHRDQSTHGQRYRSGDAAQPAWTAGAGHSRNGSRDRLGERERCPRCPRSVHRDGLLLTPSRRRPSSSRGVRHEPTRQKSGSSLIG